MLAVCLAIFCTCFVLAALPGVGISGSPFAAGPLPASQSIVYQQGVSPSAGYTGATDTYISRLGDETANYGQANTLALYSGDQQAALLRFSLPGLAPGDMIQQATLSLYVSEQPTGTSAMPVSVYRVLRPWTDGEATWYNATAQDIWTLYGCNGPGSDRESSPAASATLTTTGAWVDMDVTPLV